MKKHPTEQKIDSPLQNHKKRMIRPLRCLLFLITLIKSLLVFSNIF